VGQAGFGGWTSSAAISGRSKKAAISTAEGEPSRGSAPAASSAVTIGVDRLRVLVVRGQDQQAVATGAGQVHRQSGVDVLGQFHGVTLAREVQRALEELEFLIGQVAHTGEPTAWLPVRPDGVGG
jgi:hypothetical protein